MFRILICLISAILLTITLEIGKRYLLNGDTFSLDTISLDIINEILGLSEPNAWANICKLIIVFASIYLALFSLLSCSRTISNAKKTTKEIDNHWLLSSKNPIVTTDYVTRDNETIEYSSSLIEKLTNEITELNQPQKKIAGNYLLSILQTYRQTQSINDAKLDLQNNTEQLFEQWIVSLTWCNFSRIALPMLGFLGTIIGIMVSMTGLSKKLEEAPDTETMREAITELINQIGVAFDTSLIALSLSFIVFAFMTNTQRKLWETARESEITSEKLIKRMKIPNWTKRTDFILKGLVRQAHQEYLHEIGRDDAGEN